MRKSKYHIQFQINKKTESYLGEWETIQRIMFDSYKEAKCYWDNMPLIQQEHSKVNEIK